MLDGRAQQKSSRLLGNILLRQSMQCSFRLLKNQMEYPLSCTIGQNLPPLAALTLQSLFCRHFFKNMEVFSSIHLSIANIRANMGRGEKRNHSNCCSIYKPVLFRKQSEIGAFLELFFEGRVNRVVPPQGYLVATPGGRINASEVWLLVQAG